MLLSAAFRCSQNCLAQVSVSGMSRLGDDERYWGLMGRLIKGNDRETEFSSFARSLRPIIGGKSNAGLFVQSLFAAISDEEDGARLLSINLERFRSYFNAKSDISVVAKMVHAHMDRGKFENYLESFGPDAQQALFDAFAPEIPDLTPENCCEKCADRFADIIRKAAAIGRGPRSKRTSSEYRDDRTARLLPFVAEAGWKCPLCSRNLVAGTRAKMPFKAQLVALMPAEARGDYLLEGEYRAIVPTAPAYDSPDNFIALCPNCAADYQSEPTVKEYERLTLAKHRLTEQREAVAEIDAATLDERLIKVIEALRGTQDASSLSALEMNAYCLKQKLGDGDRLLFNTVLNNVLCYYPFVGERLRLLEDDGAPSFRLIAIQVQDCADRLIAHGLGKRQVYDSLVDWIMRQTASDDRLACGVIVSYFIQNCEVFHASAK